MSAYLDELRQSSRELLGESNHRWSTAMESILAVNRHYAETKQPRSNTQTVADMISGVEYGLVTQETSALFNVYGNLPAYMVMFDIDSDRFILRSDEALEMVTILINEPHELQRLPHLASSLRTLFETYARLTHASRSDESYSLVLFYAQTRGVSCDAPHYELRLIRRWTNAQNSSDVNEQPLEFPNCLCGVDMGTRYISSRDGLLKEHVGGYNPYTHDYNVLDPHQNYRILQNIQARNKSIYQALTKQYASVNVNKCSVTNASPTETPSSREAVSVCPECEKVKTTLRTSLQSLKDSHAQAIRGLESKLSTERMQYEQEQRETRQHLLAQQTCTSTTNDVETERRTRVEFELDLLRSSFVETELELQEQLQSYARTLYANESQIQLLLDPLQDKSNRRKGRRPRSLNLAPDSFESKADDAERGRHEEGEPATENAEVVKSLHLQIKQVRKEAALRCDEMTSTLSVARHEANVSLEACETLTEELEQANHLLEQQKLEHRTTQERLIQVQNELCKTNADLVRTRKNSSLLETNVARKLRERTQMADATKRELELVRDNLKQLRTQLAHEQATRKTLEFELVQLKKSPSSVTTCDNSAQTKTEMDSSNASERDLSDACSCTRGIHDAFEATSQTSEKEDVVERSTLSNSETETVSTDSNVGLQAIPEAISIANPLSTPYFANGMLYGPPSPTSTRGRKKKHASQEAKSRCNPSADSSEKPTPSATPQAVAYGPPYWASNSHPNGYPHTYPNMHPNAYLNMHPNAYPSIHPNAYVGPPPQGHLFLPASDSAISSPMGMTVPLPQASFPPHTPPPFPHTTPNVEALYRGAHGNELTHAHSRFLQLLTEATDGSPAHATYVLSRLQASAHNYPQARRDMSLLMGLVDPSMTPS